MTISIFVSVTRGAGTGLGRSEGAFLKGKVGGLTAASLVPLSLLPKIRAHKVGLSDAGPLLSGNRVINKFSPQTYTDCIQPPASTSYPWDIPEGYGSSS